MKLGQKKKKKSTLMMTVALRQYLSGLTWPGQKAQATGQLLRMVVDCIIVQVLAVPPTHGKLLHLLHVDIRLGHVTCSGQ